MARGLDSLATTEVDGVADGIALLAAPARALYGVAPGKNEVGIVGIGMGESVPNAVDKSFGMRGAAYAEGVEVAATAVLNDDDDSPSSRESDSRQNPEP